ncbi:MAG: hypothetical protein WAO71_02135 [Gallionella sp.]
MLILFLQRGAQSLPCADEYWDESKRPITLTGRGLDFADAHLIFASMGFYVIYSG